MSVRAPTQVTPVAGYSFVYVHSSGEDENIPSLSWCKSVYDRLPRKCAEDQNMIMQIHTIDYI